jgi:hypothetical protein
VVAIVADAEQHVRAVRSGGRGEQIAAATADWSRRRKNQLSFRRFREKRRETALESKLETGHGRVHRKPRSIQKKVGVFWDDARVIQW